MRVCVLRRTMSALAKIYAVSCTFLKLSGVSTFLDSCVISKNSYGRLYMCKNHFRKRNCLILECKQINTDGSLASKDSYVGENVYARSVIEKLPVYSRNLAPVSVGKILVMENQFLDIIKKDWMCESTDALYSGFEMMSHYIADSSHDVSNNKIENLCENIMRRCGEMTDEKLTGLLCCLRLWPVPLRVNLPIFMSIWSAIDEECVRRIRTWDVDKVLYVSDHWYELHLAQKTKHLWHGNFKLGKKPTRLSPHQLIQCMFYINVYQKWHPKFIKYEFEYSIGKCLDKLTLDEIGIFAMTFFKWKIRIYSPDLMSEILARIMNEMDTVHNVTLTAILKALRISITADLSDMLYDLLAKLECQGPRLSHVSLIHAALSGTGKNIQVFHKNLMQYVSEKFCSEISSARLKDIEWLAFVLAQYDFDPKTKPCIYQVISEQLKSPGRKQEFQQFPKSLHRILYYLSIRNIYNLDIIDSVLEEQYIRSIYGKKEYSYGPELLGLDAGIEVECQEYKGNRLNPRARERIAKKNIHWIPPKGKKSYSIIDQFMFEVLEILEDILGGSDNVYPIHILPQYESADIVFGMEDNRRPVNIPGEFKELPTANIKFPPTRNCETTWYAVIIGGWNLMIRREKRPGGPVVSKIRQLKTLGYTPVLVPWFDWFDLQPDEKKDFLKNMLARKELVKSVTIN